MGGRVSLEPNQVCSVRRVVEEREKKLEPSLSAA